ncbi:hypothetical protein MCOR25_011102 [Pyricularia grisea]|nr:hypothetical protein MCOR25_011102 [Pyricularia grisea]
MSFNTQSPTTNNSTGQQSGPQSSQRRAKKTWDRPDQAGAIDPRILSSPQHNSSEPSPDFASLLATAAAASITAAQAQFQLVVARDVDMDGGGSDGNTSSDEGSDGGTDDSTGATAMPETIEELATYSDEVIVAHATLLPYLAGRYTNPGLYLQLARVAFLAQARERPQFEPPKLEMVEPGTAVVERRREQSLGVMLMRHKLMLLEQQWEQPRQQQQPQQQEPAPRGGQDMDAGLLDQQEYQGHQVSGYCVDEDGDVEMEDAWL